MAQNSQEQINWISCETAQAVANTVVSRIQASADTAISRQGRFSLVLAGGTTPGRVYRMLADSRQDWEKWQLYYGDERCLPVDDKQRNSHMAMLSGLAGKAGVNHVIPAELGANPGAAQYASIVTPALPFDLVLLGLGEDGHTASLFPGQDFQPSAMVIPVHEAPKPPPDRISLTPRALQSCNEMLVIVTGSGKAQALSRWRSGENLPIAAVTSGAANVTVVVDRDAAGGGHGKPL